MEDSKIIDLYWERNEKAISATEQKYGSYCYYIAYNILHDQEDADESVNDTYLGAWNAMPPHRPNMLRTFLGKITRSISLKKWRDAHRDKRGGDEVSLVLDELSECVPSNLSVEDSVIAGELSVQINRFLGTLAPTERQVLLCRYWYLDPIDKISTDYCFTDSNLNHTGIYLYSKGKIMIHLTFDYKTDEKCTTPGQYLKYHRTFQGLSTRELAEKVGIVPATLVLYENDRHPIKHSTAVALANALGIDRNRLLDKYTAFVDYPYSSLLKKVRQDLSLTQIQMAELIGIGQTSYSGWEREIRVPRRKEYDKILAALEKLRVNVDTYLCQSASI
mgnify:CR=1 FL=1